jgi:hypothetical protein
MLFIIATYLIKLAMPPRDNICVFIIPEIESFGNRAAYLVLSTGPELIGAGAGLGTADACVVGDTTGEGLAGKLDGGTKAPC